MSRRSEKLRRVAVESAQAGHARDGWLMQPGPDASPALRVAFRPAHRRVKAEARPATPLKSCREHRVGFHCSGLALGVDRPVFLRAGRQQTGSESPEQAAALPPARAPEAGWVAAAALGNLPRGGALAFSLADPAHSSGHRGLPKRGTDQPCQETMQRLTAASPAGCGTRRAPIAPRRTCRPWLPVVGMQSPRMEPSGSFRALASTAA